MTAGVARGLAQDHLEVRIRAIELLQGGLDPEESLKGLLRAADSYAKDRKALEKQLKEGLPILDDKTTFGNLKESAAVMRNSVARMERLFDYHAEIVAALDARDDARVIHGLGTMLAVRPVGQEADGAIQALLRRPPRKALAYVVESIDSFQDVVKERSKVKRKLAKRRPAPEPKGWRGTKDAWKNAEWGRIERAVSFFAQ